MADARTLYRATSVHGASSVRLVVMLYEQILEDLRQAIRAIDENRIETRTNAINHALVIVGHLEGRLDANAGGKVARNLAHFYNLLRRKLTEAQFKVSKQILSELVTLLLELRDAWMQVDRAEASRLLSTPAEDSSAADVAAGRKIRADWKA